MTFVERMIQTEQLEKLIKRLKCPQIRECPMNGEYPSCKACQKSVKEEAADALTKLADDYADLYMDNDANLGELNLAKHECEMLRDELDTVKAERDAAIEDCKGHCKYCAFVNDYCTKPEWCCGDCEDWKWRGPQKEDNQCAT